MYLKLAIKEREKHKYIFMFIILQLSISFITAICCVSVTERQYQRYRSLKPVISRVGWFIDSTLGVIYPESDVGTGISGKDVLQKHLKNTDIICTYSVLANIAQDSWEPEMETIVYDRELVQAMNPKMAEGNWLTDGIRHPEEIEAVNSQNYYGLCAGDTLQLVPYANDRTKDAIPIKITGVLDEHAEILKMEYSKPMVSYHNFIFDTENADKPILILRQEDILRLSEQTLSPRGLLFLLYHQEITDAEKKENEEFMESNIQIHLKEPLSIIKEKSETYLQNQTAEILPVLIPLIVEPILSTELHSINLRKKTPPKFVTGKSASSCRILR